MNHRSTQQSAQCQLGTKERLSILALGLLREGETQYLGVWKSLTKPKTSSLFTSYSGRKLTLVPHDSQSMVIPLLLLRTGSQLLNSYLQSSYCAPGPCSGHTGVGGGAGGGGGEEKETEILAFAGLTS